MSEKCDQCNFDTREERQRCGVGDWKRCGVCGDWICHERQECKSEGNEPYPQEDVVCKICAGERMDNYNPVEMIIEKYHGVWGKNLQGCCLLIADEIASAVDGEIVAGELTWFGGSCRRTHWWVEKDGVVIDPMGDEFLQGEENTGRKEAHRDREIFDNLLPQYEKYRV